MESPGHAEGARPPRAVGSRQQLVGPGGDAAGLRHAGCFEQQACAGHVMCARASTYLNNLWEGGRVNRAQDPQQERKRGTLTERVLRPQVALKFGLGFLHLPTTPLASHKCPEPDTVRIVRTVGVGGAPPTHDRVNVCPILHARASFFSIGVSGEQLLELWEGSSGMIAFHGPRELHVLRAVPRAAVLLKIARLRPVSKT